MPGQINEMSNLQLMGVEPGQAIHSNQHKQRPTFTCRPNVIKSDQVTTQFISPLSWVENELYHYHALGMVQVLNVGVISQ